MKMNSTKSKLMASLLVMVLCVTAFFGSTYAWFTDSVTSSGNIIQAGNLDATLVYYDDDESAWKNASEGAIFDYDKWEPGYTAIKKVRIGNAGNLAFQFMLNIIPSATPDAGAPDIADVIDVYIFTDGSTVTRETVNAATPVGTLAELMADGDGAAHGVLYPEGATNTPAGAPVKELEVTIALKMQESAGNEYMNASVGGGFKVQLLATQLAYEGDSFGPDYDIDADYTPDYGIFKEVTATAMKKAGEDTVMVASGVKATVPVAAAVKDANEELVLTVTPSPDTVPDGFLVTEDQAILNYEIKMENLAEGNTEPIAVELQLAKGLQNVELYHNGVKIASAYNAETGILTFETASFSPFTVVYGKNIIDAEETLPVDPEDENTILIGTAEELAGLAKAVNEGTDNFKGKTVKLTADIDLRNASWKPIGTDQNPFLGNFDGQNHTISNLNVTNGGWAGLIGHAGKGNAVTIKNIVIDGATIYSNRMAGAVVGQLYGNLDNCHVTDVNITVIPNAVSGGYDNGDKVGGVVGWIGDNNNNHSLTNCSATDVTIKAYRDMGGIAGYVAWSTTISGNKVTGLDIMVDQVTNYYGDKDINANEIWGRNSVSGSNVGVTASNNVATDVNITKLTGITTAEALQAAINAGGEVTLVKDITADGTSFTVPAGVKATLNLNGSTLTVKHTEAKATCAIDNKGTLTIKNGTVTYEGVGDNAFGYGTNTINNSGKLVINGATIENTTDGGSSNAIDNAPGSTLTVNSGNIEAKKIAIRVRDGAALTINGGNITGSRAAQIQLFQNVDADTKVTINGGKLTGTSGLAFYSIADGKCTFARTYVNITGGTFDGDVAFGGGNKTAKEAVSITGGTFNGELGRYLANDGWADFRPETATELKDAIAAGESVVLGADIDLGAEQIKIPAGTNVTLNLNGHDLSGKYSGTDHYALFTIPNGAALVVEGTGNVQAVTEFAENNRYGVIFENAGELTLNGGTYNLNDSTTGKTWIIATIVDNRTSSASCATKLEINDGDYTVSGNAINLFRNYPQQGGSATIIFNNGTFNANPAKATTYIWNQEAGSNLGELYFNGGTYDSKVVYEDYNGQSDIHIKDGVTINGYSGNK